MKDKLKDKLVTISFIVSLATLVLAMGTYDYISLSRIFGTISLVISFVGFILISDFWYEKRTRRAGKPNESQKVESNKDLTIIIHQNPKTVKAGEADDI